jgi:hypothetical protein
MSKTIETLYSCETNIIARAHICSQERCKEKNASGRQWPSFVYLRKRFIYTEQKKREYLKRTNIATAESFPELSPEVRNAG